MSHLQDKRFVRCMAHRVRRKPSGCRCNKRDLPVPVWDVSNKDTNRLAHALNGNTSVGAHFVCGMCVLTIIWSLIHITYRPFFLSVSRCAVSPRNPGLPADAEVSGEVVIVDDGVAPSANQTKRRRTCTGATESASVTSQCELAALATHGAPLVRPTIPQGQSTFNAPPQLSDPDGLCLYHCCVAARDVASWRANTHNNGCGVTQDVHRELCMRAGICTRQCHLSRARERGLHDVADRLEQEGPEGYPGLDDLALVADVVGGARSPFLSARHSWLSVTKASPCTSATCLQSMGLAIVQDTSSSTRVI